MLTAAKGPNASQQYLYFASPRTLDYPFTHRLAASWRASLQTRHPSVRSKVQHKRSCLFISRQKVQSSSKRNHAQLTATLHPSQHVLDRDLQAHSLPNPHMVLNHIFTARTLQSAQYAEVHSKRLWHRMLNKQQLLPKGHQEAMNCRMSVLQRTKLTSKGLLNRFLARLDCFCKP